jgi:hypothetical protein
MKSVQNNKRIYRRDFLKGLGTIFSLSLLTSCDLSSGKNEQEYWLSAAGGKAGEFSLSWAQHPIKNDGQLTSNFRGHGLSKHPSHHHLVLMFSRRPGNQGIVSNLNTKKIEHIFSSPDHLFMEGHGCFSHDGKLLFCTETNKHTSLGIITVRETESFNVIAELPSGGLGPHEIRILPNQNVLAIANGGLIKDDKGKVINVDTMDSNIALLDFTSGKVISTHKTTNPKASLRHIDISDDGIIAAAMQVQNYNPESSDPLTSLISVDGSSILLNAPQTLLKKMQGYVGSVRINSKYRTAAFTSPRGNLALFWNIDTGEFLGQQFFHNVCGLTVSTNQEFFVLSNSAGKIRHISASTLLESTHLRQQLSAYQWDNHMITATRY